MELDDEFFVELAMGPNGELGVEVSIRVWDKCCCPHCFEDPLLRPSFIKAITRVTPQSPQIAAPKKVLPSSGRPEADIREQELLVAD
jgi:hypothetical protein